MPTREDQAYKAVLIGIVAVLSVVTLSLIGCVLYGAVT